MNEYKFPDNFLWGSATSSYQVEGGIENNDWAQAARDGTVPLAGKATDHYNRYEEDFDIAKSLGQNAHRFSVEWARVEPEEGRWDEKEIEHYQNVINTLRDRRIEPFVTIWHWTLPLWIAQQGGWQNKKTISDFAHYAQKITTSLQGVKFWTILNEPLIVTNYSYLKGTWPPHKKSLLIYFIVARNLIAGHKTAYNIIKKNNPALQIGIAHNMSYFEPAKNNFINIFLASLSAWQKNFYFLNQIRNHLDFIGLNYYFQYFVSLGFDKKKTPFTSDMGWGISPEGIYHVLTELKKHKKPIYITENGIADAKDEKREKFIKDHLYWVWRAIQDGVGVRGYFYWSLLDNFEWGKGFWPRFGLVEINYETLERKIRPSAYKYAEICKTNSLNF